MFITYTAQISYLMNINLPCDDSGWIYLWYIHAVTFMQWKCKYLQWNGHCCYAGCTLPWSVVEIIVTWELRNLDPTTGIAVKYSVTLNE